MSGKLKIYQNISCSWLVSHREVLSEIDKLRSDTSTGIDDTPVKFVKLAKEHLASPLQYIINNCITQSTFPEAWKVSRISPISKVDQPLSCIIDLSQFCRHCQRVLSGLF